MKMVINCQNLFSFFLNSLMAVMRRQKNYWNTKEAGIRNSTKKETGHRQNIRSEGVVDKPYQADLQTDHPLAGKS